MNKLKILIAMVGCGITMVYAADAPLIAKLRPGLSWKVESLPLSERIQHALIPVTNSITVTTAFIVESNILGLDFRKQILRPEAEAVTRYIRGNSVYKLNADGTIQVDPVDALMEGGLTLPNRLAEFDWIKTSQFLGEEIVDNTKCQIWLLPQNENRPGFLVAAIGVDDGLPRRLENPLQVLRYTFETKNTIPTFPQEITAMIEHIREKMARQIQKYAIPQ